MLETDRGSIKHGSTGGAGMLNSKQSVLIVEDESAVRSLMSTALELEGYKVEKAATGTQAILDAASRKPDAIMLDLGLPDIDGIDVIAKVRQWSTVPIIVVSARLEDADKVEALDAGADDYLVKPFSVDELLARVRAALRRTGQFASDTLQNESSYCNGGLSIDYLSETVSVDGRSVHLTPMEYRLLCLLARNTGKVLTYNFILKEVWGSSLSCDISSLRVFMATLRKKVESDTARPMYIRTHIGVGYCMLRVAGE